MLRALLSSAAGLVAASVLTAGAAAAQSSSGPVNATVASRAAYGERAGEGESATSDSTEMARRRAAPEGRPNPGRPEFKDPEFQGQARATSEPKLTGQTAREAGREGDEDEPDVNLSVLTLDSGFFFDNYTSGSGFGVYGGEAVTSGQVQQLELPSAGRIFQNLGFPTGPRQAETAAGSGGRTDD